MNNLRKKLARGRKTWIGLSALLTLPLTLTGCQTTQTTATTDDVCLVWKAVRYSGKGDTSETVDQVVALNAARAVYCAPH
jgi:hypothetical protein